MIEKNDWRLTNQGNYLKGKILIYKEFEKYSEEWNHEHCEFCLKTFSYSSGDLHEGYSTVDNYYWICKECYEDFRDTFKWKVSTDWV